MIVREAKPEDNKKLLELERNTAQGGWIKLAFEKKDFFSKSSRFQKSKVLVTEENEEIVGTFSAGVKEVLVNNKKHFAGALFDLRLNSEFRDKIRKEYHYTFYKIDKWLEEQDVILSYGYIRIDNQAALKPILKRGYKILASVKYYTVPVFRRMKVNENTFIYDTEKILKIINLNKSDLTLFFQRKNSDDPLWYKTIGVESGDSSVYCRIWNMSLEKTIMLYKMPWYLKLLSGISKFLSSFLPLPYFPGIGEQIKFWFITDLVYSGSAAKKLFKQLYKKVNNLALQEKIYMIILPENESENIGKSIPVLLKPIFDFYFIGKVFKNNLGLDFKNLDLDVRDF